MTSAPETASSAEETPSKREVFLLVYPEDPRTRAHWAMLVPEKNGSVKGTLIHVLGTPSTGYGLEIKPYDLSHTKENYHKVSLGNFEESKVDLLVKISTIVPTPGVSKKPLDPFEMEKIFKVYLGIKDNDSDDAETSADDTVSPETPDSILEEELDSPQGIQETEPQQPSVEEPAVEETAPKRNRVRILGYKQRGNARQKLAQDAAAVDHEIGEQTIFEETGLYDEGDQHWLRNYVTMLMSEGILAKEVVTIMKNAPEN